MDKQVWSPTKMRKVKIGVMVKEGDAFILDDTLLMSEEDFEKVLEAVDLMPLNVKVLKKDVQ